MSTAKHLMLWTLLLPLTACEIDDKGRALIDEEQDASFLDPCRELGRLETQSIQDFELGMGTLWWVSSDGTGQMEQLPGREPAASEIEGGRCGVSRYGLRISASGLEIFGGAFGTNFFPEPIDASSWDGVAFWARRGAASKRTVFVALSDKYTDQFDGKMHFQDEQPYCEEVTEDSTNKCDRFGVGIGLETDWHLYTIRFDEMEQRGLGKPAPQLDLSGIIGINISFETGDWDIWVDDVVFFREKM